MEAEQKRRKPASGGSATLAAITAPVVRLSVTRETDASWKSAFPKNGTVVSSWFTNTSTPLPSLAGASPMPSGIPWKVNPSIVSPLLIIARTDELAGTPGSNVMAGACGVRKSAVAMIGKSVVGTTNATATMNAAIGDQIRFACKDIELTSFLLI